MTTRCQSPKYENGFKHLWHLASGRAMNTRCQSPKYENGFKHLWHLASGRAMNTNDENL